MICYLLLSLSLHYVLIRGVVQAFSEHCYSGKDPDFGGWWRTCEPSFLHCQILETT